MPYSEGDWVELLDDHGGAMRQRAVHKVTEIDYTNELPFLVKDINADSRHFPIRVKATQMRRVRLMGPQAAFQPENGAAAAPAAPKNGDVLGGFRIGQVVWLRSHRTDREWWHNKKAKIVNFWPDLKKEVEVEIAGKEKFVRLRNISMDSPGNGSDTEPYPSFPVRPENGAAAAQAGPKDGVVLGGPAADKQRILQLESMVRDVQAQTDHYAATAELLRCRGKRRRQNLLQAEEDNKWLREELGDSARVLARQVIENGNLRTQMLQAEEDNTRAAKRLCIGAVLTGAALGVAACQALTASVASVASAASTAFTVHGASVASAASTAFTVHGASVASAASTAFTASAASVVFDALAYM